MQTCPHCKGKKGFSYDPNPYWLDDPEFMKPEEWKDCTECRGKGEVSPLAYAVYMARGGQKPAQCKGYA